MNIALLSLSFLLSGPAAADAVVDALQAELERSADQLALEGAEAPYFVGYDLLDTREVQVQAVLGGLARFEQTANRELGVAVRVGSPDLDNSNFRARGQGNGFSRTSVVLEDHPQAIRHDAWLITDRQYKSAVENLARKRAERRSEVQRPDRPPDFSPGEPHQAHLAALPPPDADALARRARELSAVFREHPEVESSVVRVYSGTGRRVLLDSLGTSVQRPFGETDLRVVASIRAEDGECAWDHASWYTRHPDQLPSPPVMETEARLLVARLSAWSEAPKAEEDYVGPVIFEDDAAVSIFRSLLLPHLSGTPPEEQAQGRFGREQNRSRAFRIGRRVLPEGWSVVDDPQANPDAPSGFAWDDEGVPAQRVQVVEDGRVRTLLSSRTPSEEVPLSNGHGRAFPGHLARGLPTQVTVTPARLRTPRRLDRRAQALAEDYDLDHVMVIRRLKDPSVEESGGGGMYSFFARMTRDQGEVPAPLVMVRRYADGAEEPVRGLRFEDLDRRALRDIVLAGELHTRTFLYGEDGDAYGNSPLHGLPVTVTAPTVLVSEVVLVPDEAPTERGPIVPSPLVEYR